MTGRWLSRGASRQGRGALAALAVSIAGAGFSAHAGLTLGNETGATPAAVVPRDADEHFPGAALLYADEAPPTPGTTGTVALPDAPVPDIGAGDASIRPAMPFVLRGTMLDRARALQCLTTAIYYEAASEPDDGQAAVAQVILNRARHPTFPATVCGVVYQGSEKRGCQFSFACDGSLARVPMKAAWERARRAAARALAGGVFAPVGLATHYHTYAVTPSWNRGLVMTGVFGAHFFHRWKGWWGTPAAFTRQHAGGEPPPGPPARLATGVTATAAVALAPAPPAPSTRTATAPAADMLPEHGASGEIRAEFAGTQILDRWKDAGKPLR